MTENEDWVLYKPQRMAFANHIVYSTDAVLSNLFVNLELKKPKCAKLVKCQPQRVLTTENLRAPRRY